MPVFVVHKYIWVIKTYRSFADNRNEIPMNCYLHIAAILQH